MKIYTKTGDSGTTSLMGGRRVDKSSLRIKAYGEIDELNSLIGVILSGKVDRDLLKKLARVQKELFVLGTDLATPKEEKIKVPRVTEVYVKRLEGEIDEATKKLETLKNFILPGGGAAGAKLHLSRTVARRAERSISKLSQEEKINKNAIIYINRLSDWLFTMARLSNKLEGQSENVWLGRGEKVS